MPAHPNNLYEFGPFTLDLQEKVLLRDGQSVSLTPKAFDTLSVLVERSGRLVEKEDLIKLLWPDNYVEENSLSQNVYLLRKALGEDPNGARYIETVPRRGYRFVGQVREIVPSSPPSGASGTLEPVSTPALGADLDPSNDAGRVAVAPQQNVRFSTRHLLAVGVFAVLLSAAVALYVRTRTTAPTKAPAQSIAVLPLRALGTLGIENGDQQLGLGITDAIIAKFSNLDQITVRPTSAIFRFAGTNYNVAKVGAELGVDANTRRDSPATGRARSRDRAIDQCPQWRTDLG
jgi:DNA-binding winged helix-turn-helix (wHTH) protein